MFTGIITATGPLLLREKRIHTHLTIGEPQLSEKLKIGDSLAVNGVCLTLVAIHPQGRMEFQLSNETMIRSHFSDLSMGSLLNLELPLRLTDFLGGHWVTGHSDGTVRLRRIQKGSDMNRFSFTFRERGWRRFLIPKGSVALNGVSLTLVEVNPTWFSVEVIPHTLQATNLRFLQVGERVNIELDFIGKYIYNFCQSRLK